MTLLHRSAFALLLLTAAAFLLSQPLRADDAARPAKPKAAIFAGGTNEDLKMIREALGKIPGIKVKADEIQFGDFRRDGGVFTSFFTIEIADLGKTDVGAIAKAVSAANTSKKERTPPAMFVVIRYKPDSTKNEPFRAALAKVKGVQPEKSWVGDSNLWVSIDGSGQSKLAEITRALHGAEIKIVDPITSTTNEP
jgi:hypothetical protein